MQKKKKKKKKKQRQEYVWTLKETFNLCKTNPFVSSLAKIITIGLEACSKISQGLVKALEQGHKIFPKFVETGFLKIRKYLFINYTVQYRNWKKITKKRDPSNEFISYSNTTTNVSWLAERQPAKPINSILKLLTISLLGVVHGWHLEREILFQKVLSGVDWANFFNNLENRKRLS